MPTLPLDLLGLRSMFFRGGMNRLSVVSVFFFALGLFINAETASALEWRIGLTPAPQYAGAKGKAKYRDRGGEREFQVEVENLRRLRGANLPVEVNGVTVGSMRINVFGNGRFSRNSDLGQQVPVIARRSVVIIRRPNRVRVFSGRF
jgi:hypothetical protein